jgi:hypothetical protein
MEMFMILVWFRREELKFQTARANLQAMLSQQGADDKTIMEAFEDLKNCFFPYLNNQREEHVKQMRKALERELARGPLQVTPTMDMNAVKVAARLERGARQLRERAVMTQQGQLEELDRQVRFQQGRRRPRDVSSTRPGNVAPTAFHIP